MNDREEIEEMAKCMANCENTCDECFEQLESVTKKKIKDREQHCHVYTFAKRAVEQGYRKIPEDFITVSEFEYKDLKYRLNRAMQYNSLLQKEIDEVKEELRTCVEIKNQACKETAAQILNEQYQECKVAEKEVLIARGGNKNDDYYKGFSLGMTNAKMHIQELAKQFDVEIQEKNNGK